MLFVGHKFACKKEASCTSGRPTGFYAEESLNAIRVLVVDDSALVRRLITEALASDPLVEVVGVAADGRAAVSKFQQLSPDVVTMDIEMPVMDGLEAVRAIRRFNRLTPIIMFSTLTERGAKATLEALGAGASDYVTKPSNSASLADSLSHVAADLIPRIKALCAKRSHPVLKQVSSAPAVKTLPLSGSFKPRVVVVGSSTGGPDALAKVVSGFRVLLPVPVVVVQHMPALFTTQLASHLDRIGPNRVLEVGAGVEVKPGFIYVAPGDFHLELKRSAGGARTHLQQEPLVNFCRPAVDVLFQSAASAFGGDVLGVVLTGMGSDGKKGSQAIVAAGGRVIAQDEASSVVWGMPGAVSNASLASEILPLPEVAPVVLRTLGVK